MRWVAKNAVAAGLADRLEVQVAYAIGKAAPVACTWRASAPHTSATRRSSAPSTMCSTCAPARSSTTSNLLRPIYTATATYGHFGRDLPDFTWERLDRVDALRSAVGL